jgi:hypothetical protein
VKARTRISNHAEDTLQQTLPHAFVHRNQLRSHFIEKFRSIKEAVAKFGRI